MNSLFDLIAILFLVHTLTFVFSVKFRVFMILKYCKRFKREGQLNYDEYFSLVERYKSFLGYMESFPDSANFPTIYSDVKFLRFTKRFRILIRYLCFSISIFATILILLEVIYKGNQ